MAEAYTSLKVHEKVDFKQREYQNDTTRLATNKGSKEPKLEFHTVQTEKHSNQKSLVSSAIV